MAGDWIPMRHDLHDDPDVISLAEVMEVDTFAVVGRLHWLWSWVDRHFENPGSVCNVSVTQVRFIESALCAPGVFRAMERVKWARVTKTGYALLRLDKHLAQTAKKRLLTARRVRNCRKRSCNADALPQKRREEKRIKDPPNPPKGGRGSSRKQERKERQAAEFNAKVEAIRKRGGGGNG